MWVCLSTSHTSEFTRCCESDSSLTWRRKSIGPREPHDGDQRASFADVVRVRTLLLHVAHEEVEVAQEGFVHRAL